MVKLGWRPFAAQTVLAMANADQRRVVDAAGEFRLRLEKEAESLSGVAQHCISAGAYEICFRVSEDGVEVHEVRIREDSA